MPIERVIFFTHSKTLSALEQFRVYGPLTHAGVEILNGVDGDQLNLEAINNAQLVLFQRDFSGPFIDYQKVIQRARELGKPVVLDLDDHLLALPPDHPDRVSTYYASGLAALLYAILDADAITVTTPVLKQAIEPYNPNVYVLPNLLDDAIWTFQQPKIVVDKESIKILFMGTPTHKPDLEMVVEPLVNLAHRYGDQISFIFYGLELPGQLGELETAQYLPVKTYDYKPFVSDLQQIEADIAIAPLADNLFNRCKSPIKFFEYSAMGLPGVYSKLEPYEQVVDEGVDGFLADKPNEWEDKISLLIENAFIRNDIARKAQEKVRKNWMIHDHAHLWLDSYSVIIEKGLKQNTNNPQYLSILKSIAEQLEEQDYHRAGIQRDLYEKIQLLQQTNAETVAKAEEDLKQLAEARLWSEVRAAEENIKIKATYTDLELANTSLQKQIGEQVEQIQQLQLEGKRQIDHIGQLQSLEAQQKEQIQDLSKQNQDLASALESSRCEVVDYVLSDSWKITRPMRKISRILRRK